MSSPIDTTFVSGTTITSEWLNGVNDHVIGVEASTGSALVGFIQSGTGASTRTVQAKTRDLVSVKDFGAIGDGLVDDTIAIQSAINSLLAGGVLYFPTGTYLITNELVANTGVLLQGGQRYDRTNNTNGSGLNVKTSIIWGSLSAGYMYTIKPTNIGDIVFGGGSENIEWNGSNTATAAVHLDNTKFAVFDGKVRQCVYAGVVVDSASGSTGNFSMHNHIRSLEFIYGTSTSTQNAHGLILGGNGSTVPSTQQLVGDVSGLVYNGYLTKISETDNAQFQSVHVAVQSGGSGGAIYVAAVGAQSSNHNIFFYVNGPIKQENGVIGNTFVNYISEAGGISQVSGSSQWHGELQDYVSGERFKSRVYKLRDSMSIPSGSFVGDAATGLGDVGIQWRTISFPDAVTSSASVLIPAPYEYGAGVLESVDFIVSTNGTSNGNYRLNVTASTAASAGSLVTPDVTVLQTYSAGSQYEPNTLNVSLSSLAFVKGDIICIRLQRIGADVLDTNTDAMLIIGAKLNYVSSGPTSGGSGSYTIPVWN